MATSSSNRLVIWIQTQSANPIFISNMLAEGKSVIRLMLPNFDVFLTGGNEALTVASKYNSEYPLLIFCVMQRLDKLTVTPPQFDSSIATTQS